MDHIQVPDFGKETPDCLAVLLSCSDSACPVIEFLMSRTNVNQTLFKLTNYSPIQSLFQAEKQELFLKPLNSTRNILVTIPWGNMCEARRRWVRRGEPPRSKKRTRTTARCFVTRASWNVWLELLCTNQRRSEGDWFYQWKGSHQCTSINELWTHTCAISIDWRFNGEIKL